MARAAGRSKPRRVVGGVDTHKGTHHAAVVLMSGARVADAAFPATVEGYQRLLGWLRGFGRVYAVGVEGTGSYGAGLARHLHRQGVRVVEVNRPDRRERRSRGKSDPVDAYAAADAVLAGRARAVPKLGDGAVEAIRVLHRTRAGAVKARTAAVNELRAVLITAPAELRERLAGRPTAALINACARLRPHRQASDPHTATALALRHLAGRYQALTSEIHALDKQLHQLIHTTRPDLLALHGVGPETAAQLLITCGDNPDRLHTDAAFAALTGTAPLPASSGTTTRHRLNRGGDRQANRALHTIVTTRLRSCPTTRAYAARRTSEGLNKREIIRCLKRYAARQIYKILTNPPPTTPAAAVDKT